MVTGSASERTIVGWQSRKVMVRVQARCGGVRKSFIYTGTVYKSIDRGDFLLSALTPVLDPNETPFHHSK